MRPSDSGYRAAGACPLKNPTLHEQGRAINATESSSMLESALVPFTETRDGLVDTATGELIAADDADDAEIKVMALLEEGWKALANARSIQDMSLLRDQAAAAKYLMRKRHMSLESQNEAAKLHLGASLRMGDWLRNGIEKDKGGRPITGCAVQPVSESADTYSSLGIEKTDAFRLQRFWDWEKETSGASKAITALQETGKEIVVSKLIAAAVRYFRHEVIKQDIQDAEAATEELEIPTSRYRCIVIDPPWNMQKIVRDVRPNQVGFDYPTMTQEELLAFPISDLADSACHLYVWTTQKFLPDALELVKTWGFKYVFTMVWHKPGGFQPVGLPQYNCEFVVFGRKGGLPFEDTKAFPTCFNAPRREHSRKPDEFYELVKRVSAGPRIDVFSREKREDFDQYGNQTSHFASTEAA